MIINKNAWHYKWYRWFRNTEPNQTNLCPYARTVFLYTPLKFLFVKGFIGRVPVPVLIYPPLLFEIPRWLGMVSYEAKFGVYFVYGMAAIIATVFALSYGLSQLFVYIGNKNLRSKMTDQEWGDFVNLYDRDKRYLPVRLKKESFKDKITRISEKIQKSLIWNYIKALHEKVCPIIRFE